MLDWITKLQTDIGPVSIKDMMTVHSGKKIKDYHNRFYTAQIKSDRRYVKQAMNFRVVPDTKFKLKNERGEWKRLEYIYFFGSTDFTFRLYFSIKGLKDFNDKMPSDEAVVRCHPRQQFLVMDGEKYRWKKVSQFKGISKEFIKLRHDSLNFAEYVGVNKSFKRTQFVSIKAEDSLGVCLDTGIVALSST